MGLPVTVSHVAAVMTVRSFSKRFVLDAVLGSTGTACDWAAQDLPPCSFLSRAALCPGTFCSGEAFLSVPGETVAAERLKRGQRDSGAEFLL